MSPKTPKRKLLKRRRRTTVSSENIDSIVRTTGNVAADLKKIQADVRKINDDPRIVNAIKRLREVLPGDASLTAVPTDNSGSPTVISKMLADIDKRRPGALAHAGLGALQIWQAMAESQAGPGAEEPTKELDPETGEYRQAGGPPQMAIIFTDLVEFSSWALEAGDDNAVELLHSVSAAIEPPVLKHKGQVVKRLGDGMMAVFDDPAAAIDALEAGQQRLAKVKVGGYRPKMRAGMHVGRPRKVDDDYFGVDVNIAARVAEAASADQLLLSGEAVEAVGADKLKLDAQPPVKAKGVPEGLELFAATSRG